jgi:hypothetical protein
LAGLGRRLLRVGGPEARRGEAIEEISCGTR